MGLRDRLRGTAHQDDSAEVVLVVDLPVTVDADRVRSVVAGWAAGTLPTPDAAVLLCPGVVLGGPETDGPRQRWLVLAASQQEAAVLISTPSTGTAEALVDLVALVAASWGRRRPRQRVDLLAGTPALALALADGLARRFDGTVGIGAGQPAVPPRAEPTRLVLLREWPDPATACAALASILPGLMVTGDAPNGEAWVAEAATGFGMWLSDREVTAPGVDGWLSDTDPATAPLQAGSEFGWALSVEGPDDIQTPRAAEVLDAAAVALAQVLDGRAVDAAGFPVPDPR